MALEMTSTRERIVEASAESIRQQGYAATGVKQIVTAAQARLAPHITTFPAAKSSSMPRRSRDPVRSMPN
jgi:2C-methyl-D-erythritol 2,4-cyclodiphosphate synthase